MADKRKGGSDESTSIYRIPPYYYIHILDQNTNVTSVEVGPKTYIRQDNEKVVFGPQQMITIPPRHYCVIENPVQTDDGGKVVFDANDQAKLKHADLEIRLAQEPFPLYPGEILKKPKTPLQVVPANSALRLRALLDYTTDDKKSFVAGDEWLFEGPGTYIPRKEVEVVETIRAVIIKPNQAIKLRARKETLDREDQPRVTGEEWIVQKTGAYLPGAYEEVVAIVDAYVLTDKNALHMRATRTFTDDKLKKVRKNGEEWLISLQETETHIPNVYEEVLNVVNITTLNNRQYCVICDPVGKEGKPQLGQKKLVKGEKSFFLQPGERLEKGTQDVYVLGEDEGLILKTTEEFMDGKMKRAPGDRWMIRGPREYVPPVEVEVANHRRAIPLDANEGVYVRNIKSGQVRAVIGETYMLNQDEELWAKQLPPVVEDLLLQGKDPVADRSDRKAGGGASAKSRDKTKVVGFRVPHNAAVQIYDYKEKKARVIFGPDLVMLGPDEQFTVLSISGGKPKRPNVIKALCLLLGPDFCTDIVVVETADHARLSLQLSYNWYFDHKDKDGAKLFSVPDFIGDACKAIASRIRGAVASVKFDDFHKNSAKIIRASVFGLDEKNKVRERFTFPANALNITSVDIQSVEPVDQRTRDALQKSVQLAIEITTASQEASAKHEADRLEQEARGRLERQKIQDEAASEKARRELLQLQAESAAVESTGQAKAEAQSRAEAARIEGEAAVKQAQLKSEATSIEAESELKRLSAAREAETRYIKDQNVLEISKTQELANIEAVKFQQMVEAIGANTIQSIATSGPEMQVKLLKSLGLQSTLITDGKSPINLFNTAEGLISTQVAKRSRRRRRSSCDSDDSSQS